MNKKRAYILGIAGKATASLAKMFLDMGWEVEGSDQNCYPPASTFLDEMGVTYRTPYDADNLQGKPDLVIVGGNSLIVNKENPEYIKAKELGLEVVSFPEVLQQFVVKKHSIVPVGTYGKTTTTAVLSWVLYENGLDPSFMIGAIPLNFGTGIRLSEGEWSIVEGDEHPTLNYSPNPKFYWYDPTIVLLTAARWDHVNVYPTEESYKKVFHELMERMSIKEEGVVIACLDAPNVEEVLTSAKGEVVTYSVHNKEADYFVESISYDNDFTRFVVQGETVVSPLMGEHNVQNVLGCLAVAHRAGISTSDFSSALQTFKGINRRLEVHETARGVTVIDDHAHSPAIARASLAAVRTRYRDNRVIVVFDPSSSSMRERVSLEWYPGKFDDASEVLVAKLPRAKGTQSDERVLGPEIVSAIAETQPSVQYMPVDENLVSHLNTTAQEGDVIIFMSAAGFRGMIQETIRRLQSPL